MVKKKVIKHQKYKNMIISSKKVIKQQKRKLYLSLTTNLIDI